MSTKEEYIYQILNLTPKFYADYPQPPYNEILRKDIRPYNCLLVQSNYGYYICIPYRSHIKHNDAYIFKNSVRTKRGRSGLDYSKIIIIKNGEYLEEKDAVIDSDEYSQLPIT